MRPAVRFARSDSPWRTLASPRPTRYAMDFPRVRQKSRGRCRHRSASGVMVERDQLPTLVSAMTAPASMQTNNPPK